MQETLRNWMWFVCGILVVISFSLWGKLGAWLAVLAYVLYAIVDVIVLCKKNA